MENTKEVANIMDIREQLRKPFPPEAISPHPTKSFLSTIKAIYITERLNDLFGIGGWILEHEIIFDDPEYVAVRGRLIIGEPYNIRTSDQYGGHGKTGKNTEPADGYKSAMTDCQSKCASHLEIGIDVFKGLGDKSKEPTKKEPIVPFKTAADAADAVQKKLKADLSKAMGDMTTSGKKKFFAWLTEKYEGEGVEQLQLMLKDIEVLKKEWLSPEAKDDVPDFNDDIEM